MNQGMYWVPIIRSSVRLRAYGYIHTRYIRTDPRRQVGPSPFPAARSDVLSTAVQGPCTTLVLLVLVESSYLSQSAPVPKTCHIGQV